MVVVGIYVVSSEDDNKDTKPELDSLGEDGEVKELAPDCDFDVIDGSGDKLLLDEYMFVGVSHKQSR